jgi:hypothetical protein
MGYAGLGGGWVLQDAWVDAGCEVRIGGAVMGGEGSGVQDVGCIGWETYRMEGAEWEVQDGGAEWETWDERCGMGSAVWEVQCGRSRM